MNDRKRLVQRLTVIAVVSHHTVQFARSADQITARALQGPQHAGCRFAGFANALTSDIKAFSRYAHFICALLHALQMLFGLGAKQFHRVHHGAVLFGHRVEQVANLLLQSADHLARTTVQFDLGDFSGLIHLRAILLQLLEQATQLIAQNID
ncbi:hypothetical protein D9M68_806520 [compost metagenome]